MKKKIILKIGFIFILAYGLNWIWENLHSILYVHYKGGSITKIVLARATLFDAVFITAMAAIFIAIKLFKKNGGAKVYMWIIIFVAILFAVLIERHALETGRWAYGEIMPIIPLLSVGLTPTIQLGFLTYVIFKITDLKQ